MGNQPRLAEKLGASQKQAERGRAAQAASPAPARQAHTVTLSLTGPEWRELCRASAKLRSKPHELAHVAATDCTRELLRDDSLAVSLLNAVIDRFDGEVRP